MISEGQQIISQVVSVDERVKVRVTAGAKGLTLIVGPSGAGKTSLIGTMATWVYKTTGKKTRLVTGDGGGYDTIKHLELAGILDAWDVSGRVHPFESIHFACRGYWPKDKGDMTTVPVAPTPETWNEVGAIVFEGLTGFGDIFLSDLTRRVAGGDKIGETASAKFTDGTLNIGSPAMTHYGITQRKLADLVQSTRALPVYIIWTATELKGTDDQTRLPVFGPKLVGKAATDDAPRWFGNTLSLAEIAGATKGTKERRLYVTTWFDIDNPNIPHMAKCRIPSLVLGTPFQMNGTKYEKVPDYFVFNAMDTTLLGDFHALVESKQAEAADVTRKSLAT